jgi:hypothetical protein
MPYREGGSRVLDANFEPGEPAKALTYRLLMKSHIFWWRHGQLSNAGICLRGPAALPAPEEGHIMLQSCSKSQMPLYSRQIL